MSLFIIWTFEFLKEEIFSQMIHFFIYFYLYLEEVFKDDNKIIFFITEEVIKNNNLNFLESLYINFHFCIHEILKTQQEIEDLNRSDRKVKDNIILNALKEKNIKSIKENSCFTNHEEGNFYFNNRFS